MAVCQGIIEVAVGALGGLGEPPPRVDRVTVEVGRLTGIVPASLAWYFDLLTPGTALQGAALVVDEIPIRGRCTDCGARFEIETLAFTCPGCGSGFVELLSGRELRVVSLETAEEVARGG